MVRATRSKVREKIARYWPDEDPEAIMSVLNEYGIESWEGWRTRVYLAILKLSEGDKDRLPGLVKMAKADYRDVLAYAEYPEEMRTDVLEFRKLSREEAQAIRQRDREQYLAWLEE